MGTKYSRPLNANLHGKLTEELKTKVTGDAHTLFTAEARKRGMTNAELLRDLAMIFVYGVDTLVTVHEVRINELETLGREWGALTDPKAAKP